LQKERKMAWAVRLVVFLAPDLVELLQLGSPKAYRAEMVNHGFQSGSSGEVGMRKVSGFHLRKELINQAMRRS
jgi:hypothetical protein